MSTLKRPTAQTIDNGAGFALSLDRDGFVWVIGPNGRTLHLAFIPDTLPDQWRNARGVFYFRPPDRSWDPVVACVSNDAFTALAEHVFAAWDKRNEGSE